MFYSTHFISLNTKPCLGIAIETRVPIKTNVYIKNIFTRYYKILKELIYMI